MTSLRRKGSDSFKADLLFTLIRFILKRYRSHFKRRGTWWSHHDVARWTNAFIRKDH